MDVYYIVLHEFNWPGGSRLRIVDASLWRLGMVEVWFLRLRILEAGIWRMRIWEARINIGWLDA